MGVHRMSALLPRCLSGVLMAAVLTTAPARADEPAAVARRAPAPPADPWFGRDKALHFSASAALALGGYGVTALVTPREGTRLAVGATVALGAGVAKEISDRYTGGDPSWR